MEESVKVKTISNQNFDSKDAIIPNDKKWSEKLKYYRAKKNAYNFNLYNFPGYVTHKFQKEQENSFNPITQKYTDLSQEKSIKKYDNQVKIDDISKAYDNELSLESTYNVINLKNKLQSLNYSEDKYFHNNKMPKNNSITNKNFNKPYNIISNNPFNIQHYLPTELREKLPGPETSNEGIIPIKKKRNYYNDKYNKDFDIINNRYIFFHKEKETAEKEIQALKAAKKIQNLKTYDIIKRKFINPEIEENYRKTIELQNSKGKKVSKDKSRNKNYVICNPLNNQVYDKDAQKAQDEKEHEKLNKFRLRDKIENLYRNTDINNEMKIENKFKTIGKEFEIKIINDRGYDIINHSPFNEKNKMLRHKTYKEMSDWEKLKSLADEKNSTFGKKTIYKSMYDKSDVTENYKNYLIKRKLKLRELTSLNEDPIFKISAENDKMRNSISSFTKTFNYSNKFGGKLRNNTMETERRRRDYIIYKFNNTNNLFNKKNFYENKRNILDYDNKDSRPILIDKNVNTRYLKNYIAKLGKKNYNKQKY